MGICSMMFLDKDYFKWILFQIVVFFLLLEGWMFKVFDVIVRCYDVYDDYDDGGNIQSIIDLI